MLKNVGNLQFVSEVRPEVVRDISKSVFKKVKIIQVTPDAFMEKIWGTEMCIKFESDEFSITGDYCNKADSKVEELGKGTAVCVACRRSDSESEYHGFVTVVISIVIIVLLLVLSGRVGVFILVFALRVIAFHVIIY